MHTTISPPTIKPLSLEQVKQWCLIDADNTEHDAVLNMLIDDVLDYCEKYIGKLIVRREVTVKADYTDFDRRGFLDLPYGPNIEITGITRLHRGVTAVLSLEGDYWVGGHTLYFPRWIGTGDAYPVYTITYLAGMISAAGTLTGNLRLAMQKIINESWDKRGSSATGTIVARVPMDAHMHLKLEVKNIMF